MTALWIFSKQTQEDISGIPIVGAKGYVYNEGTTTPRAVFANPELTIAQAQPFETDSEGRWPSVYVQPGIYSTRIFPPAGNLIINIPSVDPGLATNVAGLLPLISGGTGAATANQARSNLGAASQSDLNVTNNALTAVQSGLGAANTDLETRILRTGDTMGGELKGPNATQPNSYIPLVQAQALVASAKDYALLQTVIAANGPTDLILDLSAHLTNGFKDFELSISELRPSIAAFLVMEASAFPSSWTQAGYEGNTTIWLGTTSNIISANSNISLTHNAATREQLPGANIPLVGEVRFYADGTNSKIFRYQTAYALVGTPPVARVEGAVSVPITVPLNRVRIYYTGATIAAGRVQLWGRK